VSLLAQEQSRRPGEPEALIPEARQVQRRRYGKVLAAAIALLVMISAILYAVSASTGSGRQAAGTSQGGAATAVPVANQVTMRPVLCYAPAYVASGAPATQSLPNNCAAQYQLSQSNLGVTPSANSAAGYSVNNITADPSLDTYATTPAGQIVPSQTVLLSGNGGTRYLLGPVALRLTPGSVVQSATAVRYQTGQWIVSYVLTTSGAAKNDAVMSASFHRVIALVLDGKVFTAPMIQPSQSTFASFQGRGEISGNLTQAEAKAIAAAL